MGGGGGDFVNFPCYLKRARAAQKQAAPSPPGSYPQPPLISRSKKVVAEREARQLIVLHGDPAYDYDRVALQRGGSDIGKATRAQQPRGVVARRGDIGGRFIDSG